MHLLQPLGSLPHWEPIAVRLPMSLPSGRTPRALAFQGRQDHRGPESPVALELDAPSWVKWIHRAASIGRALCRMHAPKPHRAGGARNFPLSDSCADQAAPQHDLSRQEDQSRCCWKAALQVYIYKRCRLKVRSASDISIESMELVKGWTESISPQALPAVSPYPFDNQLRGASTFAPEEYPMLCTIA